MIDEVNEDIEHIMQIKDEVKNHKISCVKYNYSLEKGVQTMTSYAALMSISCNLEYIKIINRKVSEQSKYILEADMDIVQDERIREHNMRILQLNEIKR